MQGSKEVIKSSGTYAWHEGDGLCRTIYGEAWQYMVLPSQPSVHDAAGWSDRERAAQPIKTIMTRVAEMTEYSPLMSRKLNKAMYREMHILAVSTPIAFHPSLTLPESIRDRMAVDYAGWSVHDRFTLVGFRLVQGGSKRSLTERLAELVSPSDGEADGFVPSDNFETDRRRMRSIMADAGCVPPTDRQMARALSFWVTHDRPELIPVMVEPTHMHTFSDWGACRAAERYKKTGVDCATWTRRREVRGNYPLTICTLGVTGWQGENESQVKSDWASDLLASPQAGGMGAIALSVRGLVEPGEASREQIDKDTDKVLDKAYQQMAENHKTNLKLAGELQNASDVYEMGDKPWPTLIDGHVHVAIPDVVDHAGAVVYPGKVELNPKRQDAAFRDMQIGSNIAYNPSPVIWPAPILAYSGIGSKSVAGEDSGLDRPSDLPGAMLGLCEADRLPVYISPFLAKERHTPPILMGVGDTGAGKTTLFLYLAAQWARLGDPDHPGHTIPGWFVDPKPNSDDFGPFVKSMHGKVYSLDDPNVEGILDAVRCMPETQRDEMLDTMVEMIWSCVGGHQDDKSYQSALMAIVGYGLDRGADCTGEAVSIAWRDHKAGTDGGVIDPIVDRIHHDLEQLADVYQPFRLVYGRRHGGVRLAKTEGLSLLRAGTLSIAPQVGSQAVTSVVQRWVVRMMALGAAGAVMGRNGFEVVDEAHLILGDDFGKGIVERQGRLARAQNYLPVYLSQKIDEFEAANLTEFIGRGIVLPVSAKNEDSGTRSQAQAACSLFDIPDTSTMHERMKETKELDEDSHRPNWRSLYALTNPKTKRVVRGSVPYYIGLSGNAVPVEARIPDGQLALITGKAR